MKVQLVEHSEGIVHYEGAAWVVPMKNGKEIRFGNDDHTYSWKIYEKGLIIRSTSEIEVVLTCRPNRKTKGHISSEYGTMDLDVETVFYKKTEDHIEVKYDLIQNEQRQTFHFTLTMKEETTDVH